MMYVNGWFRALAAGMGAVALVGCPGEQPSDSDTETDPIDTDTSPDYFEPDTVLIEGAFGYDAATGQARSVMVPGGNELAPYVNLRLITEDYDPDFEDTFCDVLYQIDTTAVLEPASWVAETNAFAGFDFAPEAFTESNCSDMEFDPELWTDDPVALITAYTWSLGVGPLDADLRDLLEQQVVQQLDQEAWDTGWAPYLIGGGFGGNLLEGGGVDGNYLDGNWGLAQQVDENFVLTYVDTNTNEVFDEEDELIPIEAVNVTAEGMPSGFYSLNAGSALYANCLRGLDHCED